MRARWLARRARQPGWLTFVCGRLRDDWPVASGRRRPVKRHNQSDARSACIHCARHTRDRDDESGTGDSAIDASAAFVLQRAFTQAARSGGRQQSCTDSLQRKHFCCACHSSSPSASIATRARPVGCLSDTGTKPHVALGTSFTCRRRHRHKAAFAASDGRGSAEGGRANNVESSMAQRKALLVSSSGYDPRVGFLFPLSGLC